MMVITLIQTSILCHQGPSSITPAWTFHSNIISSTQNVALKQHRHCSLNHNFGADCRYSIRTVAFTRIKFSILRGDETNFKVYKDVWKTKACNFKHKFELNILLQFIVGGLEIFQSPKLLGFKIQQLGIHLVDIHIILL